MNVDLVSIFECFVCFDYVLFLIFQCGSGYLVCFNCCLKLFCCLICCGFLGSIWNFVMEKVVNMVFFFCKYVLVGCEVNLLYNEKLEYEELCEFCLYFCFCFGVFCKW